MSLQSVDKEFSEKLFKFWKTTPTVKVLDVKTFKAIFNAEARMLIIDVLSDGFTDINPISEKSEIRHALSAKEISEAINIKHETKLEKSNLYFHINHLVKSELVEIVAQIPSGKRVTTYYGRSSKVCVTAGGKENHSYHDIIQSEKLVDLIAVMNPDSDRETIIKDLQSLETLQFYDYGIFEAWSIDAGSGIFDVDIDMRQLSGFLGIMYRFNPVVGRGLEKLAKYLNFKLVGVHHIPQGMIDKYNRDDYKSGELTKEMLFDYWKSIPIMKLISSDLSNKLFEEKGGKMEKGSLIRSLILQIIRKGIEDKKKDGNTQIRYLLTAKEILDNINPILVEKLLSEKFRLKRASLYFHLDKLEAAGYIRTAGYMMRGTSQRVTYYGRTARVISVTDYDGTPTYPILRSQGLRELIKRMNPGIDTDEMELLLGKIDFINDYNQETFPIWLERNEAILESTDIDLVKLSSIISILRRYNLDVIESIAELSKLIQFKQAA
ncbi:MAG: hypothetical protein GPJ54_08375 [Candidatus Heimdallarchaeota archaeon]|nr:hypothetical protein [Candidatus Heimdallarchaeota archaeon]